MVTVSDQLTEGAEEELVSVVFGGEQLDDLYCDLVSPLDEVSVEVPEAGTYDYQLESTIVGLDGERYEDRSSGSVDISSDTTLDLMIDEYVV
jgi:hypothetical protein